MNVWAKKEKKKSVSDTSERKSQLLAGSARRNVAFVVWEVASRRHPSIGGSGEQ